MQKIGILGFGVVGKSVLSFLHENVVAEIAVWDGRALTSEEEKLVVTSGATVAHTSINDFVAMHDVVVASPGVDVSACGQYRDRIVGELDLFAPMMHKPTVAVTGSLGKTTITKLLTALAGKLMDLRTVAGGNIGVGMLDLLASQDDFDLGFLELSSFQLESNKTYAPDVAVWTNFYPNHLDRHKTIQAYFDAKFNLFRYQRAGQKALLSLDVVQALSSQTESGIHPLKILSSTICFYSDKKPSEDVLTLITCSSFTLFYHEAGWLFKASVEHGVMGTPEKLCNMSALPSISYMQNWVCVLATLYLLGADLSKLEGVVSQGIALDDHHHRLEHCSTVRGVDFYNDSKSTLIQATQAAVQQSAQLGRPIILILGGLGKGADRSPLMEFLKTIPNLKQVYCYGPECGAFVGCSVFPTLELIMENIVATMQPGDLVLFSPSGASFDFYKNYGHRGDVFKALVRGLMCS